MRSPRISACVSSVMEFGSEGRGRPGGAPRCAPRPAGPYPSRPGVLPDDGLRCRGVLGQDDLRLAVLPLADQELALRRARLVPLERAEDRVDAVRPDPVRELRLSLMLPTAFTAACITCAAAN